MVAEDPIIPEPAIMKAIELHLQTRSDDIARIIALFIHACFTSSSYIETHEMDNLILKNQLNLSQW